MRSFMRILLSLLLAAPILLPACADEATPEPPPAQPQPEPPAQPVPPPVPAVPAKPIVQEGIRIYPAEQYLEVDATICLERGLIEVYACSPGGKTHEAMLVVKAKPQLLHFGLILLGVKEGQGCAVQGDPKNLPHGENVDLFVEWEEGGKTWRARAEDLIYNTHRKTSMEKGVWVFTGSQFVKGQDPNTGQEVDIYLANATGTVISTFRDPAAILDNSSEFSADDTSYIANEAVVPPKGTSVRLLAMSKGKGPIARREVILPVLSEENTKTAEAMIEKSLDTTGKDPNAASQARKALAALGRPVLAPLRSRTEAAEEDCQKARAALEAVLDKEGLDKAAKEARISADQPLQDLAQRNAALNALCAEIRQLLTAPDSAIENPAPVQPIQPPAPTPNGDTP